MNKTLRYCLYGLITVICVIAIFIGIITQLFKNTNDVGETNIEGSVNTVSQAETKENFKNLFTNKFNAENYDDTAITKTDATKKIVYTYTTDSTSQYTLKTVVDGKYDITASIPIININNDIANAYNLKTQNIFVNKINEVMTKSTINTICNISYTAYINNDILSVGIMCSLKEGENAQRMIVQAYNYNLKTGKDVTISDILNQRGLDENAVNNRIKSIVDKAESDAKSLSESGYNVYQRDTTSEIYNIENVDNFMQGPDGELYIIYAYGNQSFTFEMDIIEI